MTLLLNNTEIFTQSTWKELQTTAGQRGIPFLAITICHLKGTRITSSYLAHSFFRYQRTNPASPDPLTRRQITRVVVKFLPTDTERTKLVSCPKNLDLALASTNFESTDWRAQASRQYRLGLTLLSSATERSTIRNRNMFDLACCWLKGAANNGHLEARKLLATAHEIRAG